MLAAGADGALTMMTYCRRTFDRLEREEFERGMDAALHGLVDIREARTPS